MPPRVIDAPEDIWLAHDATDSGRLDPGWSLAKARVDVAKYIRADLVKITRRKFEPSIYPPRSWLSYGDLDRDYTHAELLNEVRWSEDKVFDSDVMYIRSDLVVERRKR